MAAKSKSTVRNTREAWLMSAIDILRPRFAEIEMALPELIHISVGFGYGAKRENAIILGQCWKREASQDGANHVFISPQLSVKSEVLGVLVHELIHVVDNCESGHSKSGMFADAAKLLGLEGKLTETLPSVTLEAELITMAEVLGDYPHSVLNPLTIVAQVPVGPDGKAVPRPRVHSGPGKQGNRSITCVCPTCGYNVRTTSKWLAVGLPLCPVDLEGMAPR